VSRFYEALKKVERGRPPTVNVTPIGGPRTPQVAWEFDDNICQEYERIQVWLTNHSLPDHPLQTVMVASCQKGNGATTTAVGLALTLARRLSTRVLIVDANLRTPCLDQLFAVREQGGFSDLIGNGSRTDYVRATKRPNLFVLTAGRLPRSPLDAFSPAGLTPLLGQLKTRFDYIVFDAPPLSDFPDAHALAPHVDAVMLVVEADRTLVDDARRVLRELDRGGIRTAGVVLNRQRDYTPRLIRQILARTQRLRTAKS
jgi:capsular exopolysaccharide synthesis family protein